MRFVLLSALLLTATAAHADSPAALANPAHTRAEASRGTFVAAGAGELRLIGTERRKARLARLRTRIAAEEISTDTLGSRLLAERQVEATLLPGDDDSVEELGIFSTRDAIHFVSQTLESRDSGAHLIFRGNVRGWQGDRNLSAETIPLKAIWQATVASSRLMLNGPGSWSGLSRRSMMNSPSLISMVTQ